MACHNNTPCNGSLYLDNLVIEFENNFYPINNLVIEKENIYWNKENPYNLYTSDLREIKDNLFFIMKNVNGNGIQMFNAHIKMIFDNFDKERVVENIKDLKSTGERYKATMEDMSTEVEELSDRVKENQTFDEIKENLNTSLINLNSSLIAINSNLTNYLSDGIFTSYEKGEVNSTLDEVNNLCIESLAYADALLDLYCEYKEESEQTNNNVYQYKILLETYMSQLKVNLTDVIESTTENVANGDIIPVTSCITNMIDSLVGLKTACGELKFLGAGSTIPSEIYYANDRIDKLVTSMTDLQEAMLSSMDTEKKEIETIMDKIRVTLNKIVVLSNNTIDSNGVMTENELNSFKSNCVSLQSYYNQLQGYYENYYSNPQLNSSSKSNLKDSFSTFKEKHYNLMEFVNNKLVDLHMSSGDRSSFHIIYQEYKDSRYVLMSKFTYCINEINTNSSDATLGELKRTFEAEIQELQTQYKDLSDRLILLENRVTKLEG